LTTHENHRGKLKKNSGPHVEILHFFLSIFPTSSLLFPSLLHTRWFKLLSRSENWHMPVFWQPMVLFTYNWWVIFPVLKVFSVKVGNFVSPHKVACTEYYCWRCLHKEKYWIVHRPQMVVCSSIIWRDNSKFLIIHNMCLENLELEETIEIIWFILSFFP
jgi:hypothetical protein